MNDNELKIQIAQQDTAENIASKSGVHLGTVAGWFAGTRNLSLASFLDIVAASGQTVQLCPLNRPYSIVLFDDIPPGATHYNSDYAASFEKWERGKGYVFLQDTWRPMASPRPGSMTIINSQSGEANERTTIQ